jgi:hypothetical protein
VPTKRSAIAFAFGARTGVLTTRMPSLTKTASKLRVNLLSWSADQEAETRRRLVECPGELAGLLSNPGASGVGGAAGEVDAAAAHLNEEENVEPLERDRLDGEEVDCEHAVGLLAQERRQDEPERSPAGPTPASWRIFRTVVGETFRPSPLISPAIRW